MTAYDLRISDWSSDVCSSDRCHRAPCAVSDIEPRFCESPIPNTVSRLSTCQRPLAAFDEVEEVAHVGAVAGHAGQLLPGVGEAAVRDVLRAVGPLYPRDAVAISAPALEPLAVDPPRASVVGGLVSSGG